MRVPVVATFTLAALTSCGLAQQALAQSNSPSAIQQPAYSNYIVPTQTAPKPANAVIVNPISTSGTQKPVNEYVVPVQNTTTPAATGVIVQPANRTIPDFYPPAGVSSVTPTRSDVQTNVVITVTDLQVVGGTEELQQLVRKTIATRPGGATSQRLVEKDVEALLATGLFANARGTTQTTPGGLKVVYQVEPIVVRSLQLSGAQVLTPAVANDLFKAQLGAQVSPALIQQAVQQLNKWYTNNGYVLAQVLAVRPSRQGVVMVEVAEGVVGDVKVRFVDKDGKPTQGRSKPDYLTSQFKLKPGQVFRMDVARGDLQQLYQTGLFDKADVSLNGDARKVEVTYDLTERPARSVNAGGGYSADSGIVGTVSYSDRNLNGVGQQVGVNVQASTRDLQFNGNFTNPYNPNNPDKLGYTINAFRRRGLSQTFNDDIKLPNGDQVRQGQFGGGITFTRPVDDWQASVGLNYTRTSIRDRSGNISPVDKQGNQLSFSNTGVDDLVTVSAGVTKDQRNNFINPTQGSILSLSSAQSVPIGNGNILMNQIQANYSQYVPTSLLGGSQPEVLAFNVQGGTTIGDLPPYQAFNLGGINSVRGYGNGEVASGRSFVLASAEYRFPIFNPVGGVLFADFASDLGSGDTVPGEPGVVRGKPGSGFGYGAGIRLNSPIGIIRAEYGFNDQGASKLQFGIGQRF